MNNDFNNTSTNMVTDQQMSYGSGNGEAPVPGGPVPAPAKKKSSFGGVAVILAVILLVVIVVVFLGPKLFSRFQIIGTWTQYDSGIMTEINFRNDGKYTITASSTRYSGLSKTDTDSYSVGLDGKLYLGDGGTQTYFEYDSGNKGKGGKWCIDRDILYLGTLKFVKK